MLQAIFVTLPPLPLLSILPLALLLAISWTPYSYANSHRLVIVIISVLNWVFIYLSRHQVMQQILCLKRAQVEKFVRHLVTTDTQTASQLAGHHLHESPISYDKVLISRLCNLTWIMSPTRSRSIQWNSCGSVLMNIARKMSISCDREQVEMSPACACAISNLSSEAPSGRLIITSLSGGRPTVTWQK